MADLFSREPGFGDQTGGNYLLLENGLTIRLQNVNRNNRKSRIKLTLYFYGAIKVKLYRGYKDENNVLQYSLSNDVQVLGFNKLLPTEVFFNDVTLLDKNYINYYFEIEGLSDGELLPYESGIYFSEIKATSDHTITVETALKKDINSVPLNKQEYNKTISFVMTVNRYDVAKIVNLIEKPFTLTNEISNCVDNSTLELALNSINTAYVNNYSQFMDVTINATETI